MAHVSVLRNEVIDTLDPQRGETFVDGTVGNGGHAREMGKRLGRDGVLVGIDADQEALKTARTILAELECTVHLVCENARNISTVMNDLGIDTVDGIYLDLGLRSEQLETSGRGFSFKGEEPLLMTFKADPQEADLTAGRIVNEWDVENIEAILSGYGEERYSKRIAEAIVGRRGVSPIQTTKELREIVEQAVPAAYRRGRIHPATRTFQALRIAVNDEIEALRQVLHDGWEYLDHGGRFGVISFHSLEDRIVKHFFKRLSDVDILTKKPIRPTQQEVDDNPRARSAKLRVARKQ